MPGMSEFTRWAAASSTGRVRQVNEDAAYGGRWLHAVADGLGGHVAGEVASAAAIGAVATYDAPPEPADLARILAAAVSDANAAIRRRTEANPALRGMGTTLTAMLWAGRTFGLAHIGDSRAYRLRGGQLRQLTEDHALRNLVAGASPALAPVMSRYLDGRPDRSPDLMIREAKPGDRYLLCSDGLSSVVPDESMHDALTSTHDSELAVAHLIDLANSFGGPDNITVILIDVAGEPQEGASPPLMLGACPLASNSRQDLGRVPG
jgi:protein phosphatase